MIDPFGRTITYLRVSVTDRCDFRCVYCMAEEMTFLPKSELLTLEELDRVCSAFIRLGAKKLRLTGGEPLVRQELERLIDMLAQIDGVEDIALTTNGYFLPQKAAYSDALHQGEWPIWNNRQGFGYPTVGESQTGVFYPPNLFLYGLLPLDRAYAGGRAQA